MTGEVAWNYGVGVVRINTPRSHGATGFLKRAGRIVMKDVEIQSRGEFGTIIVTSLDDKPIATSKKLLIQGMTEEKPHGWKVEGNRITSLGGYPLNVRNICATVSLRKGGRFKTVTVLDEHGYKRGTFETQKLDGELKIELPPDAMYVVVH